MKIGVLGCGYVGQAVALFLKQNGYIVSVTTRRPERMEQLKSVAHDVILINQPNDLSQFLKPLEVLLVSVAPDSFNDYRSTYLELAESVMQKLPHAPHLHQIIYTSSTSVYGEYGGAWVDEDSLVNPLNNNGQILLETENCFLSASEKDINSCIFRLGEIYGPGRLIEDRLKRSYQRKFPGDGSQYTNLIHIEDIVQAVNFAINRKLNGVYNLCNDFHKSRKDFYESLCQQHNIPSIEWDDQIASPHGGNKRVSNQKMKDLGFTFLS